MQTHNPGANPVKFNSPLKPQARKTAAEKVRTAFTSLWRSTRGPIGSGPPGPVRVPSIQTVAGPTLRAVASAATGKPRLDGGKTALAPGGDPARLAQLRAKLEGLPQPGEKPGFAAELRQQAGQLLDQAQRISGQPTARLGSPLDKAELMIKAIDASLPVDRLLTILERPRKTPDSKSGPGGLSLHQMKLANAMDDVRTERDQFMQAAAGKSTDPQETLDAMRQALKGLALSNLALLDAMEPEAPWTVEHWEAPATLRAVSVKAAGEDVPAEQREPEESLTAEHVCLDPAAHSISPRGEHVTRAALP